MPKYRVILSQIESLNQIWCVYFTPDSEEMIFLTTENDYGLKF